MSESREQRFDQDFDEAFPGCCQAALTGAMASGQYGSREETLLVESVRLGRLQAGRIAAERHAIREQRAADEIAAAQQAKADAECEKAAAAEQKRIEDQRQKKRDERADAAARAKKFAPRTAKGPGKARGGRK